MTADTKIKVSKRAVTAFVTGLLAGKPSRNQCFAVSFALQGWLSFAYGLQTELIMGSVGDRQHTWLAMEDGRIIDGTADQFAAYGHPKLPRIYIGPKPRHYGVKP